MDSDTASRFLEAQNVIFLIMSCFHQAPSLPQVVRHYELNIDARFDDEGRDIPIKTVLKFQLQPLHRHKDDSVSYRLSLSEHQAMVDGAVQESIEGRYVIVRAFEHGELLSMKHQEEWSAQAPYLAALDVIWFALYPNPPQIQKGKPKVGTTRFPLSYTSDHKGYVRYRSMWSLESIAKTISLRYESKSILKGAWRNLKMSGHGRIQGTVETSPKGGIPLSHKGVLHRDICYESRQAKCQQQKIEFALKEL